MRRWTQLGAAREALLAALDLLGQLGDLDVFEVRAGCGHQFERLADDAMAYDEDLANRSAS